MGYKSELIMGNNIIGHIENIKVFTDYKKSGFDTYEMFLEEINNGRIPFFKDFNVISTLKNAPKDDIGFDKYFEENYKSILEEQEKKKEQINRLGGYSNIYFSVIRTKVAGFAERSPDFFVNQPLEHLYNEAISVYDDLGSYLGTKKEIVEEYVDLVQNLTADNFFEYLIRLEKGEVKIEKITKIVEVKSKNPHPRIFINYNAFLIFDSWASDNNADTDFSFIYRKMQYEEYIHEYVGESEFVKFLEKFGYTSHTIEKLKTLDGIGYEKERNKKYSDLKELYPIK